MAKAAAIHNRVLPVGKHRISRAALLVLINDWERTLDQLIGNWETYFPDATRLKLLEMQTQMLNALACNFFPVVPHPNRREAR